MQHKDLKWTQANKEKLTAQARAGVSVTALAERFSTSRGNIYRILKEMGV